MGAAVQDAARKVVARLAALAGWPAQDAYAEKGQLHHGGQSRPIGDLMREAGVPELAGDGAFDLPGGAGPTPATRRPRPGPSVSCSSR